MGRLANDPMRPIVLALAPLVLLSGCLAQVQGDPPRKACGTDTLPADSVIVGTQASWAGRALTAGEGGADVRLFGGETDGPNDHWWGENAHAWAVAALGRGEKAGVIQARAGLAKYGAGQTTVHLGPGGQTVLGESYMPGAHEIVGPIHLAPHETVFLVGAADRPLDALGLHLRWAGCAQTGPIAWGSELGAVVGWPELDGPLVAANPTLGAVSYEGHYGHSFGGAIVFAQPPPPDSMGLSQADVTTSEGTTRLKGPAFFLHHDGEVGYDVTHVGGAGDEPFLAVLPIAAAAPAAA